MLFFVLHCGSTAHRSCRTCKWTQLPGVTRGFAAECHSATCASAVCTGSAFVCWLRTLSSLVVVLKEGDEYVKARKRGEAKLVLGLGPAA